MAKGTAGSSQEPQIMDMPSQNMAVVYSKGDPNEVGPQVMPALYGSVYTLKFSLKKKGVDFKVGTLRARWPDAHIVPKDQWSGIWGLPIPDEVTVLPQKVSGIEVALIHKSQFPITFESTAISDSKVGIKAFGTIGSLTALTQNTGSRFNS